MADEIELEFDSDPIFALTKQQAQVDDVDEFGDDSSEEEEKKPKVVELKPDFKKGLPSKEEIRKKNYISD
jgi:hypothetical protein